jgi:hypothetical protein
MQNIKGTTTKKCLMFQALFSYRLRALKTFYFHHKKKENKLIKTISAILIGTSYAWSVSHLSKRNSEATYDIID